MRLRKTCFLACLVVGALSAQALAVPVPASPAAQTFHVGALRVDALRDELNVVANDGKTFGTDVGPAAVGQALKAAGAPTDTLPLGVDALLVRMPGHVVLIDTGLGPKAGGVLPQSLAIAGVQPAQVTDILVTHSHGDHVGGLLTADGRLAFPSATVRMSATEWAFMQANVGQKALVAAIAPRVKPFAAGSAVIPGITFVAIFGHTPGHVGYRIVSGGQSLLDIGDTAHSAVISLARPEWTIGYDTDATEGRASREKILAQLATSHQRIFAPHFPFPGIGTVVKSGAGYAWKPDAR
jgi:glyoxylase-like metal-dependent hydrolase (beta-lactamase superfamily II)